MKPRLHLALHQIITNQLWDDDPPGPDVAGPDMTAAYRARLRKL
ncbi:hypothetical protein [Pseudonocardia parietis]|uniref:Uncharacterized protein n=1 Tax=Pseudonocardia parietis TaxID=570936 RepID=A0ABS4VXR9_9PSEU|nr:hypothetical protein [Pseudonocardia parietis]MBP2368742.1 hypothetical protein [Pseudonocardia parietis]